MIGFVINALASFTGSVLAPALQESLQHQTDISFDALKTEFIDRLRARFGRPGNHDIARAIRVAELQATEHVLRGYDKLYEILKSSGEIIDREQDPPRFIAAVHKYLNGAFRKRLTVELTDRHLDTEPTFVAREIAMGAGTLGDPTSTEEYVLLTAVEEELRERTGWKPLPTRFAHIMRHGEGGIPAWLTAFRAFLAEQIKVNRRFREILQTVLLFQLRAEQQGGRPDITSGLEKRIDEAIIQQPASLGVLGEQINSVERRLITLHGSLEGYLETHGNLDTRLVRLLEEANDPKRFSAVLQQTLDQGYWHIGGEALSGSQQVLSEIEGPLFGRRPEFEMLDRFLESHDRGILIMVAPAGLGKSTLLATWSSSVAGPDLTMIRHFFSAKRPESSGRGDMVRSLVRQVVLALGPEALGGGVPGDTADLADRLGKCLRGDRPADTRLVVVLDSLDEAAERIEPLADGHLGRGCYLVASARTEEGEQPEFLRRWRELARSTPCPFIEVTLRPLEREDIWTWVSSASDAPIDPKSGAVDRIWHASEGVPLFATFLVSDAIGRLGAHRTNGDNDFPESFVAYARGELRTLSDLWSTQIERLFALLSIVKGPIGSADISAILGDFTLSGSRIDPRIRRWFSIRDVDRQLYASFAHPRLAAVFREALQQHVLDSVHDRLMVHCRGAWQATEPSRRSAYALEWLPAHLIGLGERQEATATICHLNFLVARLSLRNPARLVNRTASETLILAGPAGAHTGLIGWWARFWAAMEAPLFELGEQRGFGRTSIASALLQAVSDVARESTLLIGASNPGEAGRSEVPFVHLSQPLLLQPSNLLRSIDHAHQEGVSSVLRVEDRLVSLGGEGAIRFWSLNGVRQPGGDPGGDERDSTLGSLAPTVRWSYGLDHSGILRIEDRLVSWGGNAMRFWSLDGRRLPGGGEIAHPLVRGVLRVEDWLVSWGEDGAIRFWSLDGARRPGGDDRAHQLGVSRVLRAEDRLISWGSKISGVRFWSLDGVPQPGRADGTHWRGVSGCLRVEDRVVTWGMDGGICFWSLDGMRQRGGDNRAHWTGVFGLLRSRDNLVSWGGDGAVRFWSLSGERQQGGDDTAHRGGVSGMLRLENGLVSWGGDGAIRFWSLDGERQRGGDGKAHRGGVSGILGLDDRLVSWGRDGAIRFWSLGGVCLSGDDGNAHEHGVDGILRVEDRLVSWGGDGAIRFWSLDGTRRSGGGDRPHRDEVEWISRVGDRILGRTASGALFDDVGRIGRNEVAGIVRVEDRLVSWGVNGSIRLWSLDGLHQLGDRKIAHEGGVRGILRVDDRLVTWGNDGAIRFWSLNAIDQKGGNESASSHRVRGILGLEDRLVSWFADGALRFWSPDGSPSPGGDPRAHKGSVLGVLRVEDRLVSWGGDGAVRFWSLDGAPQPSGNDTAHKGWILGVQRVRDRLVSWSSGGTIRFWSLDGVRHLGGAESAHKYWVAGVISVDDRLVSWGRDGAIHLWSLDGSRGPGGDKRAHRGGVSGMLRIDDRLVSWGRDGAVRLWSLKGSRLSGGDSTAHQGEVWGVRRVADRLVSWGEDGAIRFWSFDGTRRSGGHDEAHRGGVSGVVQMPDGLVSWGHDGIRFWSLDGMRELRAAPEQHWHSVSRVVQVQDRLVSWGRDGAIYFWSQYGVLQGRAQRAHYHGISKVIPFGDSLVSWGADRFVRFWSRDGGPLGCWVQPDHTPVDVGTLEGRLYLLHPSGPRRFIVNHEATG